MVFYTAWLALLGTVAAGSLQPYFSAVNKFFRDHQREHVAVGELLVDARRGLEILQHRLIPTTARLPLPAPVALAILLAADTLRRTLPWTPTALPQLQRFRACLAVCVNYIFSAAQKLAPATRRATQLSTDLRNKSDVYSCENQKATSAATPASSMFSLSL
jgi:hypothetical protein